MLRWLEIEADRQRRKDVEDALSRIIDRLGDLETAPRPIVSEAEILLAVTPILQTLDGRFAPLDPLPEAFHALVQKMKELTFAVSEGIERSDRQERRIKGTVKRARKELADHGYEDPGLESEAQDLQLVDGEGSRQVGLQPVRPGVEADPEPSSIAGVSIAELKSVKQRRMRSY